MDATVDTPATPPAADHRRPRGTGVTRAPDGSLVVRVSGGLSARLDARSVTVTLVTLAAALLVFAWAMTLGDYPMSSATWSDPGRAGRATPQLSCARSASPGA